MDSNLSQSLSLTSSYHSVIHPHCFLTILLKLRAIYNDVLGSHLCVKAFVRGRFEGCVEASAIDR